MYTPTATVASSRSKPRRSATTTHHVLAAADLRSDARPSEEAVGAVWRLPRQHGRRDAAEAGEDAALSRTAHGGYAADACSGRAVVFAGVLFDVRRHMSISAPSPRSAPERRHFGEK